MGKENKKTGGLGGKISGAGQECAGARLEFFVSLICSDNLCYLRLGRKQSKRLVTIESGVCLRISGLIYRRNCLLPRLLTYGMSQKFGET